MILALVFFSYMQSTFNSLRSRWQAAESQIRRETNLIEEWMVLRNTRGKRALTFSYEQKVKSLLRYVSRHDHSVVVESEWYRRLPDLIQYQLEKELMKNAVLQFGFLRDLEDDRLAISILRQSSVER